MYCSISRYLTTLSCVVSPPCCIRCIQEGLTIEMWLLRVGVPPYDARQVAITAGKVLAQQATSRSGASGCRRGGAREAAGGSGGRRVEPASIG